MSIIAVEVEGCTVESGKDLLVVFLHPGSFHDQNVALKDYE
jgi:hypothetical protein